MKNLVIAIHDYQHGGVGMLVKCSDIKELECSLGPTWEVISDDVEAHPFYAFALESHYEIYDFSNPTGLLSSAMKIHAREHT